MRKLSSCLGDIHDFTSREAQQLLHNKFVVIIGDSNYRAIYKDLVYILQTDMMLTSFQLKQKDEESFANDCRVEFNGPHSRNDYRLVRQYRTRHHLVRFYFITRVYSSYMESILNDFKAGLEAGLVPDVVILNSCIWDLNRYQDEIPTEPPIPKALRQYCQNAEKLFQALDGILPSTSLIIWNTALSITKDARGYVVEHPHRASAKDLIEANFCSSLLARRYGLDILDLHYRFRLLENLHAMDGLHWDGRAHRCITKVLLTHIAEAWQVELEKRRPLIRIQREETPENQQASLWRALPQAPGQPPQVACSPLLSPPTSRRTRPYTHKAKSRHRPRGSHLTAPLSDCAWLNGSYVHGPQDGPLPSSYLSTASDYSQAPHCTGYERRPMGSVEREHYSQTSYNYSSPAPHNPGANSGSTCSFEPEANPQSSPSDYSPAGYGRRPIGFTEREHYSQTSYNYSSPAPHNPGANSGSTCSFEPEAYPQSSPSDYSPAGYGRRPISFIEREHYSQTSYNYSSPAPHNPGANSGSTCSFEPEAYPQSSPSDYSPAGYGRRPIGFIEREHYSQTSYNYSSPAPHNPGANSGSTCSFEPEAYPQSSPSDYSPAGYGRRPIGFIEREHYSQTSYNYYSPAPHNPGANSGSRCFVEPESNPSDYSHAGDDCRPINFVEQQHYPQFSPTCNSEAPPSAGSGCRLLRQFELAAHPQLNPGSCPFLQPSARSAPLFVDGNEDEPFSPLHVEGTHHNSCPGPGLVAPEGCPDSFCLLRASPRGSFPKMRPMRRQCPYKRHNAYTPYAKFWNNSITPH